MALPMARPTATMSGSSPRCVAIPARRFASSTVQPSPSGRNRFDVEMPLTHDFKETIRARAQAEPEFRQSLLREAIECIINGDLATGKAVLRDYVNATVGFQGLEKRTHIPAKSLMRMLGPKGSPSAENLSTILTVLQRTEGVRFSVSTSDLG